MRGNSVTVEECEELVKGPGKFEGCARYVPYFYELMLEGAYDDDDWDTNDNVTYWFIVNEEDVAIFPELTLNDRIGIFTDDNGFVKEYK